MNSKLMNIALTAIKKKHPDRIIVFSNILTAGCVPEIKRRMNIPVVVTLQGDDIFLRGLPPKHESEALAQITRLAKSIDGFIANTRYYADAMADYLRLSRDKIAIVPLGLDTRDFQSTSLPLSPSPPRPPTIGYLARLGWSTA